MRPFNRTCVVVAILYAAFSTASAQTGRTIKMVVPYPPGGSADGLMRALAEQITKTTGTATVIENRPGGGTLIGQEHVLRALPDGNTILMNANSTVINPSLRKLAFDPLTSFEPICLLVRSPQVFVVNASSPYRTVGDLVAAAKVKPGELTLATVGPSTTQHIAGEMFKRAAQINLTYVPYPGGAPAVAALLGGHVATVLTNYSEVAEHLKAGTLRAIATTSAQRIDPLPDVPTVQEAGYKDFVAEVWFGAVAPGKTPKEKTEELAKWFTDAMNVLEVRTKLVALALYPVGMCGDAFGVHLRRSFDEYARVIREANIKVD